MELAIRENRLNMVEFQQLRLLSGMEPLDSGLLKRALKNSLVRLTAETDEGVAGMVRIVGDGAYVFIIADLLVRPDMRGGGAGTALVKHAVGWITASLPEGKWGAVTLVSASGREGFYEKLGFKRLPRGEVGHAMQIYVKGTGAQ